MQIQLPSESKGERHPRKVLALHNLNLPGMFSPLTTVTVSGLSRAVLGKRNSLRSVLALLWYTSDRIRKENCNLPA